MTIISIVWPTALACFKVLHGFPESSLNVISFLFRRTLRVTKHTSSKNLQPASPVPQTPWRDRPLHTMKTAAELCGVSIASLYRFSDEGRLTLRRLGGRTLVDTKSLIALIESAENWTPYDRGKEARAKRKEIARAALQI